MRDARKLTAGISVLTVSNVYLVTFRGGERNWREFVGWTPPATLSVPLVVIVLDTPVDLKLIDVTFTVHLVSDFDLPTLNRVHCIPITEPVTVTNHALPFVLLLL